MRALWIVLFLATSVAAQAQDDGPGFFDRLFRSDDVATDEEQGSLLERLIEDQLSGAGRQVEVTGFEGALSGEATLEQLTISDANGVWLTITDAELDWNRSALFRGRLEVAKLTAGEILLPRLPVSEGEEPTPEATGFSLPELPVAVQIGELSAGAIRLGAPVVGIAVDISATGSLSLEDGTGDADLEIVRLDGRGRVALDASYSNTSGELDLALSLEERENGIFAELVGLPGRPSVVFEIAGAAPVSDYAADIRLATDGVERLSGRVATSTTDEALRLSLDIGGDLAPVFTPEYRPFFGDDISLEVDTRRLPDGRFILDRLNLSANAVTLTGSAEIGADRLPIRIDLDGRIASPDGQPVVLPLSGEPVRIAGAELEVRFNADEGDGWAGSFDIDGFERGDITAETIALRGVGRITQGDPDSISADFTYRVQALDLGQAALQDGLGDTLSGEARIDWARGGALRIPRVTMTSDLGSLAGSAAVSFSDAGPTIDGTAALELTRLEAYSALAGRSIGGRAELEVSGTASPLAGYFDLSAKGRGQDLSFAVPGLDAILEGPSRIDLVATRDEEGLRAQVSTLETPRARLSGSADLKSGGSTATLVARLEDASVVVPEMSGPLELDVTGREDAARDWAVSAKLESPDLVAEATGRLTNLYLEPNAGGRLEAEARDLSVFSDLAGRPLSGRLALTLTGSAGFDLSSYEIDANLDGSGLGTGIAELDRLLSGDVSAVVVGDGSTDRVNLSAFSIETAALSATASGTIEDGTGTMDIRARLADIAPFAAGISGPAEIEGTIAGSGSDGFRIDVNGQGPGGLRAAISGTASEDFARLDLTADGTAPLGLANAFIAPTTVEGTADFALRLDGAPVLSSVSGRITSSGARLVAPELGVAMSGAALTADLSGGTVRIDASASVDGGGRVAVSGPIGLSEPFPADLRVTLTEASLADPRLFETRVTGDLTVTGPLAGGARIAGRLSLGETEIRIPSSSLGGAGEIPEIVHLNEPPPVRGTRRRAGLLGRSTDAGGSGPVYFLDITITAPSRIFVRGRGLDSEFGGSLRLTGTTRDIVPSGGFTLVRGRLDILGRRLDLDRARISMRGSFEPEIDIRASTQADEYRVNVDITGPADNPDFTFSSTPELPQEEVLARLIFGRGLDSISALQAARLALAVRTLAGQGGEGIVGRIRSDTGLADLDVSTSADGNTAVRAGAYLNENLYTDVTVDSAGDTRLNLNLDVSPSVTVKGGVTNEGDTSIGIFYERDY